MGQQDLGPRRERRIGRAGQGPAGFDFGDDPVRVARGPRQAGQQVAAPDLQLRFASLPGTGDAVGGERGRPRGCPRGGTPTRRRRAAPGPGYRDPPRPGRRPPWSGTGPLRCTGRWRSTTGPAGRPVPVPPPARRRRAPRTTRRGCWPGSAVSRLDQPVHSAPGRAASADRATSSAHSSRRTRTAVSSPEAASRPAANWRTVSSSAIADHRALLDLHQRLAGQAGQQSGDRLRRQRLAPGRPVRPRQGRILRAAPTAGPAAAVRPHRAAHSSRTPAPQGSGAVPAGRRRRPAAPGGPPGGPRAARARAPGTGPRPARWPAACRPAGSTPRRSRPRCPSVSVNAGLAARARVTNRLPASDAATAPAEPSSGSSSGGTGKDEFAGHVQAFPAGVHDADPRALPGQHDRHPGSRRQDVLAVVQHDQQLAGRPAPARRPPSGRRHLVPGLPAPRRRTAGTSAGSVREASSTSRAPSSKPPAASACRPQRQPGLAAPARAGQRHHAGRAQAIQDRGELRPSPHQRAHLRGQARSAARPRVRSRSPPGRASGMTRSAGIYPVRQMLTAAGEMHAPSQRRITLI